MNKNVSQSVSPSRTREICYRILELATYSLLSTVFILVCSPLSAQTHGEPLHLTCEWESGFYFQGMNGRVLTSAVFDDGDGLALYVGGQFTSADDQGAGFVAKWDGAKWTGIATNTFNDDYFWQNQVTTMAVYDDGQGAALYVGGIFTHIDGVSANYIAKWDGSTWSALDSGLNHWVYSLTVYDDGAGSALYAGGIFTGGIAKWNGHSWSAVGTGVVGGSVTALAVHDAGDGEALYAGGNFTAAGPVNTNSIAKWDGSVWSSLGSGLNGQVLALATHGEDLYAGGSFSQGDGVSVNRIAKWDGATWAPLAGGLGGSVQTLAIHDDGTGATLYAGGDFQTADGITVNRVAKWQSGAWSALDLGMNLTVNTLASYESGGAAKLYAGGSFTSAGGGGSQSNRSMGWCAMGYADRCNGRHGA